MTTDDGIRYDRSLLGVELPIGRFPITKGMVAAFCAATGETNPVYTDERKALDAAYDAPIAPPAFCCIFTSSLNRPDIKLEFGDISLIASIAIESLGVVKVGDTLEPRTKLKEVYAKTGRSGKMVFTVWETRFTNQDGETVALVRDSFVRRRRGG